MSPGELEALARELDGQRRAAESALATLVARVEEVGAFRRDGHRGARAWGMAACNWSLPESARFVKAGHLLARFGSASGMGVAQLHAVAAVAANPRVQPHPTHCPHPAEVEKPPSQRAPQRPPSPWPSAPPPGPPAGAAASARNSGADISEDIFIIACYVI